MATIQQLEAGVIAAYKAGDMDSARKLGAMLVEARKDQTNFIPGANVPGTRAEESKPEPTLTEKAVGVGEAAASVVTGIGGMVASIPSAVVQAGREVQSGQFGTPQAANRIEQAQLQAAANFTYAPRTPTGQEYLQNFAEFADKNLTPLAGMAGELGALGEITAAARAGGSAPTLARAGAEGAARSVAGDAGAAVAQTAGDAVVNGAQRVKSMTKGVTTLPKRALSMVTGTPDGTGTAPGMASGGAAATEAALQRQATADQLPVPIPLTKGQATRDPMQLKFEAETAKQPAAGAPLRENAVEQNHTILENFDNLIDQTGAEAPTLRATGQIVDKALRDRAARDKVEVRSAYRAAEKAGEMESPVSLESVVQHLNDSGPEAATAPLLTVARNKAIQTGVAEVGPDGTLVAKPVTLKTAEEFRKAIGASTDYAPTNIRQSTIIKGLVDEATDGMGGDLYRQARALRARYAQNYEDRAAISKLLNNKRGTADRQVALEDVFKHSVLDGSLDDVRNMRRVLQTAGDDGKQAWKELQGATAAHIRDQAFGNSATDASGTRVVSPAKLDKVIRELDADGKLDFIFGKQGAQQMRDIRDISMYVRTVPPEAAVNVSNTAATILAAFADAGLATAGLPVPVTTIGRMLSSHIKDAKLKARVADALAEANRRRAEQPQRARAGF